ncbi:MAG: type II toxin-antitoxin system HicA family toxin [Pseudomonadota bacterium]
MIKRLIQDGWYQVRQKGSHIQFRHPTKPDLVTVPHPRKDLAMGTIRHIERQSGIALLGV